MALRGLCVFHLLRIDVVLKLDLSHYFSDLLLSIKMIANSKIQPRFNLVQSNFF